MAQGGGLDAPVAAHRERPAHGRRQFLDEAGHRGLRERKLLRGTGHASVADAGFLGQELRKHPVAKVAAKCEILFQWPSFALQAKVSLTVHLAVNRRTARGLSRPC